MKGSGELDEIMFLQYPTDPYKIICYGSGYVNKKVFKGVHIFICMFCRCLNPVMTFITILTLPVDSCRYCKGSDKHSEGMLKLIFRLHYIKYAFHLLV